MNNSNSQQSRPEPNNGKVSPAETWQSEGELPPEIEREFLSNVEEFERHVENADLTTVRRLLGNPEILPIEELSPDQVTTELRRLLAALAAHNMVIDYERNLTEAEFYRFITEELMEEEVLEIQTPGYTQHFIYEEFHPDDEFDAADAVTSLLYSLLEPNTSLEPFFARKDLLGTDGQPTTMEQIQRHAEQFRSAYAAITRSLVRIRTCHVAEQQAVAEADLMLEGVDRATGNHIRQNGSATIRLEKDPTGEWAAIQDFLLQMLPSTPRNNP